MYHAETLGSPQADAQAGGGSPSKPEPKRILILDDNAFFARCLASLIEHEGDLVVCSVAESFRALMERLPLARPDLLVIDIALGEDNGLEVARRLRASAVATPIMLTSSMDTPDEACLREIGRCRFIAKDKRPRELISQLRHCLAAA
jgi:CheY-like chemotaxis protein